MKGFLLKQVKITIGEECFFESRSSDYNYTVMFEDDGETGYFYAAEVDPATEALAILDMLFVYDVSAVPATNKSMELSILWSADWKRCGLILGNSCQAVFDFEHKAGYNLTAF